MPVKSEDQPSIPTWVQVSAVVINAVLGASILVLVVVIDVSLIVVIMGVMGAVAMLIYAAALGRQIGRGKTR